MVRTVGKLWALALLVSVTTTSAFAEQPPPCTDDPSRTVFAGLYDGPCKKFHGDQASCELAYYMNRGGEAVSCGFVEGTCVGCGGQNLACPTNTCDGSDNPVSALVCDGDPGRTALLGQGNNGSNRCRNLDHTSQSTCENAYYEDGSDRGGTPTACFWESNTGSCIGCGRNNSARCLFNACDIDTAFADATCPEDTGRTNLLGFGGNDSGACRTLDSTDQPTCENAYYEDEDTGVGVACWWDGDDCRGSGFDDHFGMNACLSSVAPPTATATCPEDPGRTNLVGFGNNDTGPCRLLDDTEEATCENAYYEDVKSGAGIACWWDGDQCRGSLDDFRAENACQRTVTVAAATAVCADSRTNLLGFGGNDTEACRQLDDTDAATCENAYYEDYDNNTAVACMWDGSGNCRGCGGRNEDCTANACVTASCPGDPGRANFIGFGATSQSQGQNGGSCRQFDGDQSACDDSWYFSARKGRGVSCWWNGGECRGTTGKPEDDACRIPADDATCTREPARGTFTGFGNDVSRPCRNFDDTDQATCEDAYYENTKSGQPVACYWAAGDQCLGTSNDHFLHNACLRVPPVASATCAGEPGRGMLLGFGNNGSGEPGSACRALDGSDEPTCENAFYENEETGLGVACWWDGGDCRGTSRENRRHDACATTSVTCTLDPSRNNPLGFGGNDSQPCRTFDGTDQPTCEATYYVSDEGPIPVACWWDGDQCRGSSDRYFFGNECYYDEAPLVADVTCNAVPARTMLLGFGDVGSNNNGTQACRLLDNTSQATCENAYYQGLESGQAVACWWDSGDCRGSGNNNADENVCVPNTVCTLQPGRTTRLGFGHNNTSVCRQLDGSDLATCADAYYVDDDSGDPVACWWKEPDDECRGSSQKNGRLNACLRNPLPATVMCGARTNLLGFGDNNSGPCRDLDFTDQGTCENAFYEDVDDYRPIACAWNPGTGFCLGTLRWESLNVCDPAVEPAACPRDLSRTIFVGHGGSSDIGNSGGACRYFDGDQAMCESAFYVNNNNDPVACYWDGLNCRGTNGERSSRERRPFNSCLTGGVVCADSRSTVLGRGQDGSNTCKKLNDTNPSTCEDAYYIGSAGFAIACAWDANDGTCNGCGRNRGGNSACEGNACSTLECSGDLARTEIGRCRNLNSEAVCEGAWHSSGAASIAPFAASCFWSAEAEECFGCGVGSQAHKGCANACATACGNGIVDNGETCDDGNMFDGDCCSSSCQTETNGSACSDRLFCTEGGGTCQAGECVGAMARICDSCVAGDCDEVFDACGLNRRGQPAVGPAQLQGEGPRPIDMSMPLPEGSLCDDGLDGTEASVCDGEGMCIEQLVAPTPTPAGPLPAAPAPAMGRWGYAILMLGLLAISLPALRRRGTDK